MASNKVPAAQTPQILTLLRDMGKAVVGSDAGKSLVVGAAATGLAWLSDRMDARRARGQAAEAAGALHAASAASYSVFTPEGQLKRSMGVRPTAPRAPKTPEQYWLGVMQQRLVDIGAQHGIPAASYQKETPNHLMERLLHEDQAKIQGYVQALGTRLERLNAQAQVAPLDDARQGQQAQLREAIQDAQLLLGVRLPTEAEWAKKPGAFKDTLARAEAVVDKRGIFLRPAPDVPGAYRHETWALYTAQAHLVTALDKIEQMTRVDGPANPMMGGMGLGMAGQAGAFPGMSPYMGMMPGYPGFGAPPMMGSAFSAPFSTEAGGLSQQGLEAQMWERERLEAQHHQAEAAQADWLTAQR